jgi:hypothetical protein
LSAAVDEELECVHVFVEKTYLWKRMTVVPLALVAAIRHHPSVAAQPNGAAVSVAPFQTFRSVEACVQINQALESWSPKLNGTA